MVKNEELALGRIFGREERALVADGSEVHGVRVRSERGDSVDVRKRAREIWTEAIVQASRPDGFGNGGCFQKARLYVYLDLFRVVGC